MTVDTEINPEADEAEEISTPTDDADKPDAQDDEKDAADPADGEAAEKSDDDDPDDELVEVEWEGKTHRVSPEVKAGLMRQADYTRKTQAVSEQSKALQAREAALTQQSEALGEIDKDRVSLAMMETQIKAFDALDWDKLEEDDPEEANRLFRQSQRLRARHTDLKDGLAKKASDFDLDRKRSAREAHATAVKDCEATLKKDIKGWSPELATKVGDFAVSRLGWDPNRVVSLTDAAMIKTLHLAYVGDQAQRRLVQQQKLAAGDKTDPVARPGNGGAAPTARKTTDPSGDKLSTAEWIRREEEREAALRRKRS